MLEKSTFERDYLKLLLIQTCSFYRPLKLKPFDNASYYENSRKNNFLNLVHLSDLKDPEFPLAELSYSIFDRFVQLLAPLTLYHFANSSKWAYRNCLDIRGLEFSAYDSKHIQLSGFDGMRRADIKDVKAPYCQFLVCHGSREINKIPSVNCQASKYYKLLKAHIIVVLMDDAFFELYSNLIHPEVEHVHVTFYGFYAHGNHFAPNFTKFLELCKNVKTLQVYTHYQFDAECVQILERHAARAPFLELLTVVHIYSIFQLHEGIMKKCVMVDREWYWTTDLDFPIHRTYSVTCALLRKFQNIPSYYKYRHYDEIDQSVDKLLPLLPGDLPRY